MRKSGKSINFFSRHAFTLAKFISSLSHKETTGHILKVSHHVILDLGRTAQFPSFSPSTHDVGCLREVLHAARDNGFCLIKHNHLGSTHDRLHSRTANSGKGEHRNFLRNTTLQTCMACSINGLRASLERIAHNNMVN